MLGNLLVRETKDFISVGVNTSILIIFLIIAVIMLYKFKAGKNIKIMFAFYTLFWLPVSILRPYASTLWEASGFEPAGQMFLIYIATYGIVGVIIRYFSGYITTILKSRRAFCYFAIMIQLITYFPVFFIQSEATLFIQTIGTGVAASALGLINIMVKEQRLEFKVTHAVTLFALPPLFADLLSSPIQSLVIGTKDKSHDNIELLKYMWIIGIGFVFLSGILVLFVKENTNYFITDTKSREVISTDYKKLLFYLIFVSIIGLFITLAKFSTSGTLATSHIQIITNKTSGAYEGYLNAVFSGSQIIGGIFLGFFLSKKKTNNKLTAMLIGISIWITYYILCMFIKDGPSFMAVHALNGLGYGIVYNLGIMLVIELSVANKKIIPMGFYQTMAALGITISSYFGFWLKSVIYNSNLSDEDKTKAYWDNMYIQYGTLIGIGTLILLLFYLYIKHTKRAKEYLNYSLN